jgi:hypothetical protein
MPASSSAQANLILVEGNGMSFRVTVFVNGLFVQ